MIDDRARSLDMKRSQYLSHLAKTDVEAGGELTIVPQAESAQATTMDQAREVTKFLEMAVPTLISFEKGGKDPQGESDETQAEDQFWQDFLEERQQILDLERIESEKAKRDIGYREAIPIWMKHRPGWLAAHHPLSGEASCAGGQGIECNFDFPGSAGYQTTCRPSSWEKGRRSSAPECVLLPAVPKQRFVFLHSTTTAR